MMEYWFQVSKGIDLIGRELARMGLELGSVPAMSSEAERVFSWYVYLLASLYQSIA